MKFAAFRIEPPKVLPFGEGGAERREGLNRCPLCRLAATSPPKGETFKRFAEANFIAHQYSLTPAAFLAQVRKQAAQRPKHIPNALMDGAAEVIREWAIVSGCAVYDAAYISGWVIAHADACPPEYDAILDAAKRFSADCASAGYSAEYAERNFSAVIAYAATGAAQVEF